MMKKKHIKETQGRYAKRVLTSGGALPVPNRTRRFSSDGLLQASEANKLLETFRPRVDSAVAPLRMSRVKREGVPQTLEEATAQRDYTYWLTQEDIADIFRLKYNNYRETISGYTEFDTVGSLSHLSVRVEKFQAKTRARALKIAQLLLIINVENSHWTTLSIVYEHNHFKSYYVDSSGNPFPSEYREMLIKRFGIDPESVISGFKQQKDTYNCGLWALDNVYELLEMHDGKKSLPWLIGKLKKKRDEQYFITRRKVFSESLMADPVRRERHLAFVHDVVLRKNVDKGEVDTKRIRLDSSEEEKKAKLTVLLEKFVEAFLVSFMERIAAYHMAVKGERLTVEGLKTEIKTGMTAALLGAGIAQSITGSIPSFVASVRLLGAKYYPSKAKAETITRLFSDILPGDLSFMLAEVAVDIFCSFESQFTQLTDKAGDKMAMEKLAEDAVGRALKYLNKHPEDASHISKQLLEKSVLLGRSEKIFDPSLKPAQLLTRGSMIQNKEENEVRTSEVYEKIGVYEKISVTVAGAPIKINKFYKIKGRSGVNLYGYRRLFDWEKKENGELTEEFNERYEQIAFSEKEATLSQSRSRSYRYLLATGIAQQEGARILTKIQNRYPIIAKAFIEAFHKPALLFDLRKPVENFVGRNDKLSELHATLVREKATAVIPRLSDLPVLNSGSDPAYLWNGGSPVSVHGLGGIGKTQLVLRYAEHYARDYDHNVLWINAETRENIAKSFHTLATKLCLETRDRYHQEKSTVEIVKDVYDYFSDRKSLFIFDNAENYKAIEAYLPQSMLGNKPTLLITSRYSHWDHVAATLSLDVFSEAEATELIKKELKIKNGDNTQNEQIKELHQLLQGLPLALQQALAYIGLQRGLHDEFGLRDYIECYKSASKKLLNFKFSSQIHDPYVKTVFTTWQVTLDKILSDSMVGKEAIEVLNIMAYLNPESISNMLFFNLQEFKLAYILHLLKSYSIISPGTQPNTSTIHRLVQQVLRIQLEHNSPEFKKIISKITNLLQHPGFIEENNLHYLHFLLCLLDHAASNLAAPLSLTQKSLFDKVLSLDVKYWFYFLDLAYMKFQRKRYFSFMGEAMAYFIKNTSLLFLFETLKLFEKKLSIGVFSRQEVKLVVEHIYSLGRSGDLVGVFNRVSAIPEKRQRQVEAVEFIRLFEAEILGSDKAFDACRRYLKRSIDLCGLSDAEKNKAAAMRSHKLQAHLKKVAQLSHWISSALLAKNTLSDLLQGEFNSVAFNFKLITSSTLLGSLSNALLTQGEVLATGEMRLIEKDLGLASKSVLHILLNESVFSAGKRRFLGKVMKVSSPFVRRGTSVFFAANLISEIKEYRAGGGNAQLADIVSNGIIVGIDGLEAGIEALEFLELIAGVSVYMGPIGEAIAAVAWLSAEAYHVKQQMEAIQAYTHLTASERFYEAGRAFFYFDPSEYLEVKANNNKLIQRAINFLTWHLEVKQFVFSSFRSAKTSNESSEVFLDKQRNFIVDHTAWDHPSVGSLFCSPLKKSINNKVWLPSPFIAHEPSPYYHEQTLDTTFTYLCQHAIGIELALNRTGNVTFISLEEGENSVVAASFSAPIRFLVNNGKKKYIGGNGENTFILVGNAISGLLQGGQAADRLILNDFSPKNSDYLLIDTHGYLCGKKQNAVIYAETLCQDEGDRLKLDEIDHICGKNQNAVIYAETLCQDEGDRLKLDEMDHIYGRKDQQDIIYFGQHTQFIDGYGGSRDSEYPDGFFITYRSYRNPSVALRNNSFVFLMSKTGIHSVRYHISAGEAGEVAVRLPFQENIQHRFFFEYRFEDIHAITISNCSIDFSVVSHVAVNTTEDIFYIRIADSDTVVQNGHQTSNAMEWLTNSAYFFSDMAIKLLNKDQLYTQELDSNNRTMDETITFFVRLANRLGKSFFVQLMNNTTLTIGQGKHQIFYMNGLFESYLVGNGGENVYIISPLNTTVFPLPEVTLYDISSEEVGLTEQFDTLDLRAVVQKAKHLCPGAVISPRVSPIANDLLLTLSADCPVTTRLVSIKLKNTLLDNGYETLDILWEDCAVPRNIVAIDDETWMLMEVPLVFGGDKEIIFITDKDIGNESEILLLKAIGSYRFFRSGMDLILTNAFAMPSDYCTLIFHQFYYTSEIMKKKVLSTTLTFLDQSIPLQTHQEEINQAANFFDFADPLSKEAYLSQLRGLQAYLAESDQAVNVSNVADFGPTAAYVSHLDDTAPFSSLSSKTKPHLVQQRLRRQVDANEAMVEFTEKTLFFRQEIELVNKKQQKNRKTHSFNVAQATQHDLPEKFSVSKYLLHWLGWRSVVDRMNHAERMLAPSSDLRSPLELIEQRVNASIASYAAVDVGNVIASENDTTASMAYPNSTRWRGKSNEATFFQFNMVQSPVSNSSQINGLQAQHRLLP